MTISVNYAVFHTNLYNCIHHLGNQNCTYIREIQHLSDKKRSDRRMENSQLLQLEIRIIHCVELLEGV